MMLMANIVFHIVHITRFFQPIRLVGCMHMPSADTAQHSTAQTQKTHMRAAKR